MTACCPAVALLAAILYVFLGTIDLIRGRLMTRVGQWTDETLSDRLYEVIVRLPLKIGNANDGMQPLRDLDQLRSFLTGAGPIALFDLPWIPLYLGICFVLHFWIGITALIGAGILLSLAIFTEFAVRQPTREASEFGARRRVLAETGRRNADVIVALGMAGRLRSRWTEVNARHLDLQKKASDLASGLGAISRMFRLMLQSGVLAVGAYLVVHGQATAGIIIAGSILAARALAPVDLAIANWRSFVAARQSWRRLSRLLALLPRQADPMALPPPTRTVTVEGATVMPPGGLKLVLQDINLGLKAGDGLAIIGPSASGKSSLAKLLVGAWQPARGRVRIDSAALSHWSAERLGAHIGYLPQ